MQANWPRRWPVWPVWTRPARATSCGLRKITKFPRLRYDRGLGFRAVPAQRKVIGSARLGEELAMRAFFAILVLFATAAHAETAVEAIEAHKHMGVATCSNSVCHGAS